MKPILARKIKYLLLLLIALIWGSQFMLNKLILASFTPEGLAFFRAFIGCLCLSLLIPFTPEKNLKKSLNKKIKILFLIGFLEASLPFYLISYGQLVISSAMTAILMASIALFTLLLVFLFIKNEKISQYKLFGILLSFVGVLVLLTPDIQTGLHENLLGDLAVLGGAFCFALSLVLIKIFCQEIPPIRTARMILFSAVIQLGMISLIRWHPFWYHTPTLPASIELSCLGIFSGGIVYVLYVILIRTAGASFTGLTNYLVPLVGVLLGVLILGEPLYLLTLLGIVIVLIGMVFCEY